MINNVRFANMGTVNQNRIELNDLIIWFSYETPVGFAYKGERFVRKNDWSTTTGKLLNKIEPNKDNRIDGDLFEAKLTKIISSI